MTKIESVEGDEKRYRIVFEFIYGEIIKSISILFSKNVQGIKMHRDETNKHVWRGEIILDAGIYLYKYVINPIVRVNDPDACEYDVDSEGEVWSKLVVGDMEYFEGSKGMKICGTQLSTMPNFSIVTAVYPITVKKIYLAVNIKLQSGVHSVSVIWYHGDGKIIRFEERAILTYECDVDKVCKAVFLLTVAEAFFVPGTCRVDILFDGRYMRANYFQILKKGENLRNYINVIV